MDLRRGEANRRVRRMAEVVLDRQGARTALEDTVTRRVFRQVLPERMLRSEHHEGPLRRPLVGPDQLRDGGGLQDLQSVG